MNILRNGFNRVLFMLQELCELPMNSPNTKKKICNCIIEFKHFVFIILLSYRNLPTCNMVMVSDLVVLFRKWIVLPISAVKTNVAGLCFIMFFLLLFRNYHVLVQFSKIQKIFFYVKNLLNKYFYYSLPRIVKFFDYPPISIDNDQP